jgi:hypothetical protein
MKAISIVKKNLLLFAAVVLVFSVIAQSAFADWLSGWDYRKEQTITGSTAGAQTNYQMRMTVHKGSGTDCATDVYCSGNCRDDFGDIRWTTSDGITLMNYWIESVTSGDKAVFWIRIPSIPASPSTVDVYMYYSNPSATSLSNGANTFPLLFDDIEDGSISDWDQSLLNGIEASTTQARGTYSIRIYDATPLYTAQTDKTFTERAIGKAIVWIYPDNTGSNVYQEISFLDGYSNKFVIQVFSDGSIRWLDGSPQHWQQWQEFPTPTDLQRQTWSCLYFKWDCIANEIELYVDGTSKGKGGAYATGTAIDTLKIGSGCMVGTGQSGYFDDFCIGEYVSPEPTWGTCGEPYKLTWSTIDGGGGTSAGGNYALTATISQPDASYSKGGSYELLGGFWPGGPLCIVDFKDFARFAEYWLLSGSSLPADLDKNGVVDFYDLKIFADVWLCTCPYNWPLR